MTKSDLIAQLFALNPYLHHENAERVVDTVFEEIAKGLIAGDRVELRGFGIFSVKKRKARTARNPKTGEAIQVKSKSLPFFKAGREMHAGLNGTASRD